MEHAPKQGDEFDEDGAPHQKMVAYLSLQN